MKFTFVIHYGFFLKPFNTDSEFICEFVLETYQKLFGPMFYGTNLFDFQCENNSELFIWW